jgi:hypothetical protein
MQVDISFRNATLEGIKQWVEKHLHTDQLELSFDAPALAAKVVQLPVETDDAEDDVPMDAAVAQLDVNGLPWDERIHASTKTFTAKGEWKRKRGISELLFETVADELRSQSRQLPVQPVKLDPVTERNDAVNLSLKQQAFAPVTLPPVQQTSAPVTLPPVVQAGERTFAGLMQIISNLFANNVLQPTYLTELAQKITQGSGIQVNAIVDIMDNPSLVNYAYEILKFEGKIA